MLAVTVCAGWQACGHCAFVSPEGCVVILARQRLSSEAAQACSKDGCARRAQAHTHGHTKHKAHKAHTANNTRAHTHTHTCTHTHARAGAAHIAWLVSTRGTTTTSRKDRQLDSFILNIILCYPTPGSTPAPCHPPASLSVHSNGDLRVRHVVGLSMGPMLRFF